MSQTSSALQPVVSQLIVDPPESEFRPRPREGAAFTHQVFQQKLAVRLKANSLREGRSRSAVSRHSAPSTRRGCKLRGSFELPPTRGCRLRGRSLVERKFRVQRPTVRNRKRRGREASATVAPAWKDSVASPGRKLAAVCTWSASRRTVSGLNPHSGGSRGNWGTKGGSTDLVWDVGRGVHYLGFRVGGRSFGRASRGIAGVLESRVLSRGC
ncbi:hypothetical protein H8959_015509 [Pygathrix nigripes]